MSEDRGMMKYLPYQSLIEQSTYLRKMRYEKGKSEKPAMFEEKAMKINAILVSYANQEACVHYHRGGYPHFEKGKIMRIDSDYRYLVINYNHIDFKELTDIVIEEEGEFF